MIPAINIGPLVLPTAALIYILGAWLSLGLVERAAKWLKVDADKTYGVASTGLVAGLVGARLVFVAIYWRAFSDNLLSVVWPLNTGYNLWGGLVVGLGAAFFYGRYKQVDPGATLDALAPGMLLALISVSLADFLAGPGFGTLTRVPWAITQYSMRRHPVQIYEIITGLVALFIWWRTYKWRLLGGQLFLIVTAVYSGGRLLVDAFRDNPWITSGGYHIVQIISLVAMVVSLYLLSHFSETKIRQTT